MLVTTDGRTCAPAGPPGAPSSQPAARPQPAASGRTRRVLVVEDDPSLRMVLRLVLEDAFEVLEASDGAEAMRWLARDGVDVVLLDLMMPVMSGHEVLERMRSAGIRTPVVVMTASLADLPLAAPVHQVMRKPFEVDELERILGEVVATP